MISLFKKLSKPKAPAVTAIYIPEDTLVESAAYYDTMTSLVAYTNAVMHDALYLTSEFPEEASWLYHADYYIAQVNNGGHSQFLGNSRTIPGHSEAIALAMKGMTLIGCTVLAEILERLENWRQQYPQEALLQGGFGQRADALELLNKEFFAFENESFYQAVNTWFRSSSVVKILPANAVAKAVSGLKDANPRYSARKRVNTIAALDAGLVKDTVAPFRSCVAGATTHGNPFEVKAVISGQPKGDQILWSLQTSTGPMVGLIGESEVEMFVTNPEDRSLHRIFNRPIARVNAQLERAAHGKPARCAYELGQKLFPQDPIVRLGFYTAERDNTLNAKDRDLYIVTTKSEAQYFMILDLDAAAIINNETNGVLGKIIGKEFKALRDEDHTRLT